MLGFLKRNRKGDQAPASTATAASRPQGPRGHQANWRVMRYLRTQIRQVTQRQMAADLDVTLATVQAWERNPKAKSRWGRHWSPAPDNVQALTQYFGVPKEVLCLSLDAALQYLLAAGTATRRKEKR